MDVKSREVEVKSRASDEWEEAESRSTWGLQETLEDISGTLKN